MRLIIIFSFQSFLNIMSVRTILYLNYSHPVQVLSSNRQCNHCYFSLDITTFAIICHWEFCNPKPWISFILFLIAIISQYNFVIITIQNDTYNFVIITIQNDTMKFKYLFYHWYDKGWILNNISEIQELDGHVESNIVLFSVCVRINSHALSHNG